MTKRTIDEINLGPNKSTQGGARCFSLWMGRVFQRQCKDASGCKIPATKISQINHVPRNQNCTKGLKFRYRQSMINCIISVGVICGASGTHRNAEEIIQHDIVIDAEENTEVAGHHDEQQNYDDSVEEVEEADDDDIGLDSNSNVGANSTNDIASVENRADEEVQASDQANEERVAIYRSGHASRSRDFKINFPRAGTFFQDSADNNQNDELRAENEDGSWIESCCYDEEGVTKKLGEGDFYKSS